MKQATVGSRYHLVRLRLLPLLPILIAAAAAPAQGESLRGWLRAALADENARGVRYAVGRADLDGDGVQDAVVRVSGEGWCGSGGCRLYVLRRVPGGWRRVGTITVVQVPVRLLPGRSHGWRDLGVFVRGGGILPGYEAVLSFDGRFYPRNPSVPRARPARRGQPGRTLISDTTPELPLYP